MVTEGHLARYHRSVVESQEKLILKEGLEAGLVGMSASELEEMFAAAAEAEEK